MQVTMTRGEIRDEIQARMGLISGSINAQSEPQLNALINRAYLRTLRRMTWVSATGIARSTLLEDGITLSLPADVTIGGILDMYWWDARTKRHHWIAPGRTYGDRDYEPANGTDDDESLRGPPAYWEHWIDTPATGTGQIRISPPADQPYEIHIKYQINVPMDLDATACPVDAECVVLAALALLAVGDGDTEMARGYESKWQTAIDEMRRVTHQGESFSINAAYDMHTSETGEAYARLPNWDRSPST